MSKNAVKKTVKATKKTGTKGTDLVRFVEELKRQWMATIDALVDPLMIVRQDYTISKANRALAQLAGHEVKDLIGKKCHEVFAGKKKPCKGCKLMDASEQKTPTHFSLEQVRGDRYFEVTSQPIFDSKGSIEGIVQVYRDRTEAKQMQEQLAQAEKLASIGLLAGGIAHEINNPLGGILIFSQMLLRELPKESPHYPDVQEIEAATQRCKGIVESLLEFARTRPANSKAVLGPVTVDEAAKTALRFAKVHPDVRNVEVVEDWHDNGAMVTGDRNKLVQVFLNLIQNAFQAMPDGGTLTLRSSVKSKGGRRLGYFEVEDTGVGIPPEYIKTIFDPFFTTKDPGEGTGLGLAICYGIVNDLGGSIEAESKVNVGTKFRVILPLAAASDQSLAS
jgi:two-component system, NtrC family, sensor kinase